MDAMAVFTPEQGRLLWQDYQSRRQLKPQLHQNFPQRRPIDEPSPHRVFVKNNTSEAIPAYACMQITGTEVYGDQTVVSVTKPTSTDGVYLFNSPYEIAIGAVSWAYRFGVIIMLGDPPSEAGAQYLPIVASWEIEEGPGPFVVYGEHNVVEGALIGTFSGGGSPVISDGIVRIAHPCGVYTIELGELQDVDESASGSGANCSPCDDESGSGSGCELILSPPPQRVVGNGTFVVAFDPTSITIPLAVDTDCVVTRVSSSGASSSGTGSGSGAFSATPWRVRGYQEHIVQYRERWDCCAPDGPPVLIGKTPIVFVGKECPEIICGECPPSSGSA